MDFFTNVRDRLLRYARIGTQSDHNSASFPTTECQRELAALLYRELTALGCADCFYDEAACIVYAKLPSNLPEGERDEPFGLIAHMDTAPDVCGENVKPWVLERYDGGDIVLNAAQGIVMRSADYPNLAQYAGQALVLTDGTTLLGGDDKAAIAAILCFAEYCMKTPEFRHGTVCLAFTPDEEVGGLARDLDLERFGAKQAYTIDGDHLGCYQDQTFNAAQAKIEITGLSVHPATAKGILVNAVELAAEFLSALPEKERPQFADGTDGFYYVTSCRADCEHAAIRIILRDFDRAVLERRKAFLLAQAERMNARFDRPRVRVELEDEYYNMGEILREHPEITARLDRAIRAAGLEPVSEPFRGGTDGAALTYRGLPCPNLSAGYENAHGRFEFVPIPSMVKNVEILQRLCEEYRK